MESFRNWYIRNQDAISWFLIGWLTFGTLDSLVNGQYVWAAISAFLVWVNYKLTAVRLQ